MSTTTPTAPAPATPAQARLYQQLRGHLAALKLHTAAEHLPAVLDTATTEDLSSPPPSNASSPWKSTPARPAASPPGAVRLPAHPATLEDFDYDAQPVVDRALITEQATCRYLDSATNILLIGPPGTGKTHHPRRHARRRTAAHPAVAGARDHAPGRGRGRPDPGRRGLARGRTGAG
jgi:Cdc6-like AAA superfamily ATPase